MAPIWALGLWRVDGASGAADIRGGTDRAGVIGRTGQERQGGQDRMVWHEGPQEHLVTPARTLISATNCVVVHYSQLGILFSAWVLSFTYDSRKISGRTKALTWATGGSVLSSERSVFLSYPLSSKSSVFLSL